MNWNSSPWATASQAACADSGDAGVKVEPARPPWAAGAAPAQPLPRPAHDRLHHVG